MTIKCSQCELPATTYCILDGSVACDDHATGDYHRDLNEEEN